MTKLAHRLAAKIKKDLGITVEPIIRRNWTSYFHNDDGVNTWHMREIQPHRQTDHHSPGIGSAWRASECVKTKYKLRLGLSDLTGSQIELEEIV